MRSVPEAIGRMDPERDQVLSWFWFASDSSSCESPIARMLCISLFDGLVCGDVALLEYR
jgi:hypothetical protein